MLSRHYWILHSNFLIKSELKQYVQRVKFKEVMVQQQIDHLPKDRIQVTKSNSAQFRSILILNPRSNLAL